MQLVTTPYRFAFFVAALNKEVLSSKRALITRRDHNKSQLIKSIAKRAFLRECIVQKLPLKFTKVCMCWSPQFTV